MSSRPPPIPPGNRPKGGPAAPGKSDSEAKAGDEQAANPDKRGQTANTRINTTHQGYQQDR